MSNLRIKPLLCAISSAPKFIAPFSSSSRLREDDALAVKLAQELKVETDLKNSSSEGETIGMESITPPNEFELVDTPGEEEVVLTKSHNNETVRVTFNIADINNEPIDTEPVDESYDEEDAAADGAKTDPVAPAAEAEAEAEESYTSSESFPIKLEVTITKPDKAGALVIECHAQDGELMVENLYYFKDSGLAKAETYDAEKKRTNAYAGPPFGNLDEELQGLIGTFLGERGVDALLAEWVAEYIDAKEQREYVGWLKGVKEFIE